MKPLFIVLEGGEGTGKTTQTKLLAEYLRNKKIDVVQTREPGSCEETLKIRSLLVEGGADRWAPDSEVLLFNTARNEHLRKLIRPSLDQGKWIVCDRFSDSTFVYQNSRGASSKLLDFLTDHVVGETKPNLTLVLNLPIKSGLDRSAIAAPHEQRFESMGDDFHQKLQKGFLELAAKDPSRYAIINATGTIEEVHARIVAAVEDFITKKSAAA